MLAWIRRLFAAPVFSNPADSLEENKDKTRIANLLNTILLAFLIAAAVYVAGVSFWVPRPTTRLLISGPMIILLPIAWCLMRLGRVRLAGGLLSSGLWVVITLAAICSGGPTVPGIGGSYIMVILIAGLLFSRWAAIGFSALTILAGAGMYFAGIAGALPRPSLVVTPASSWAAENLVLLLATGLLYLAVRGIDGALAQARLSQRVQQEVNRRLQREIIERERIEKELQESLSQWRSLSETTPDTIVLVDRDGTIQFINHTVTGRAASDAIGMNVCDHVPPEHQPIIMEAIERVFQTGEADSYELVGRGKQGLTSWYSSRLGPVERDGKVVAATIISTDITPQKMTEESLLESKERLSQAQRLAHLGNWVYDIGEDQEHWSNETFRIFGFEPQQFEIGHETFMDSVHPDDRGSVRDAVAEALAEAKPYSINFRIVLPDGVERIVHSQAEIIVDKSEQPVRMIGTIQDITEQVRIKEEVQKSRDLLLALIDSSPAMIYVKDPQGRYLLVNRKFASAAGLAREQVLGKTDHDFMPREIADAFRATDEKVLKARTPVRSEETAIFEGEVHTTMSFKSVLLDADENPYATFGVSTDITERKRIETALRKSESRYRAIVEDNPDMVCRFTPDTTLTFVNEAYCQYFDKTRDELVGSSFLQLIPKDSHDGIKEYIHSILVEKQDLSYTHEVVSPSGDLRWHHWTDRPILDSAGEVVEMQSIGRDITERKLIGERINASLQEKEVLLKEIHHRVKNNLQVITSLLYLQTEQTKDPETLELIQASRDRVKSMALIHETLYQTRDLSRVDLAEYIHTLVEHLSQSYGADLRGITLKTDGSDISLEMDSAVPCGLIINELVTNALKYAFPPPEDKMPDGQIREVRISFSSSDAGQLTLTVHDNGVGFPPGLDIQSTKRLGLRLVNRLVGQLEGAIALHRNGGTEIKVTLPRLGHEQRS